MADTNEPLAGFSGDNLRTLRESAELTQKALATLSGSSQQEIHKYEADLRTPNLNSAAALIAALRTKGLECSLDDLVDWSTT